VENIPFQAERHSGKAIKTVRLATGIGVRFHNGMVFGFRPESRSSSTGFPRMGHFLRRAGWMTGKLDAIIMFAMFS
jgi:hypothetical protein